MTTPGKTIRTVLLVLILALGLVRLYRIDDPPIGYHSMKEVHYLSVARGYLEHGDFAHKRVLYSGLSEKPGYIEGLPQFQFLPLIYFSLWKIFGVKLWIARLVVILFSLGSVVMAFRVAGKLTDRGDVPVLAAFFMAILPLSVFFGRNIQPEAPALFFLLLLTWYYLNWLDAFRGKDLIFFSLTVFLTAMIKGTFLIMLVPLMFLFPFRTLADRDTRNRIFRQAAWLLPGMVLTTAWLVFTKITQTGERSIFPIERLFLPEAFTLAYWKQRIPIVWQYAGDNYTFPFLFVFATGLAGAFFDLKRRMSRYLAGSSLAVIVYFLLISDFAIRHSYYQMPFLPMICFGIAAALSDWMLVIGAMAKKRRGLKYLLPLLVIGFAAPSVKNSLDLHFDKQMIGCDIAGIYIRDHGQPEDRVFIAYGSPSDGKYEAWRTQYYGILWESGKRGSLLPPDLEKVKYGEDKCRMKWIVMFYPKWLDADREILDYIKGNYSIRQEGFAGDNLLYHVLERGGSFDPSAFERVKAKPARLYEFSDREIVLSVKEID